VSLPPLVRGGTKAGDSVSQKVSNMANALSKEFDQILKDYPKGHPERKAKVDEWHQKFRETYYPKRGKA
jgi:hypothetical protein